MSLLNDKVAVVTGAGRGIGRAVAIAYARMGADVVCVSRTEENSAKVAAEVEELGRKAWAKAVDVSNTGAVEAAAKEILEQAGKVDILVNNAGVTRDNLLMRMSEEEWDTVLNTNLKGAFNFTKAFTRPFMKQRSGRIINIASVIGLIGNAGQSNYAASKAGLGALARSLAIELARHDIQVNNLQPGWIETDATQPMLDNELLSTTVVKRTPARRWGTPADFAGIAVYLASDASRFHTGDTICVDGGYSIF